MAHKELPRPEYTLEVRWQDPPSNLRGTRGKHVPVAEMLRKHPGRWALVTTVRSKAYATLIRTAKFACYAPAGSFEATSRKNADGMFDIYARYVGEGDQ